jgi:hypothetical protein
MTAGEWIDFAGSHAVDMLVMGSHANCVIGDLLKGQTVGVPFDPLWQTLAVTLEPFQFSSR